MFNFLKDACAVDLDVAAGFAGNSTLPRWTVIADSKLYIFILAG